MSARFVVVAAVDLGESAGGVVERAFEEAARREAAELHFVHVHREQGEPFDHQPEEAVAALEERLIDLVDEALAAWGHDPAAEGPWRVAVQVRTGRPADEIARLALEVNADLVLVGRVIGGRGAQALGSVADGVLRLVTCPVLVVHTPAPPVAWEAARTADESASLRRTVLSPHADFLIRGEPMI